MIPLSQPKQIFALNKLGNPIIPQGGVGGASAGKLGLDKLGEGGKIVTLPSSGTTASSGGGSGTGKIVEMPSNGVNKSGTLQSSKLESLHNSKLAGEVIHTQDRPVKSYSPLHVDQQPTKFRQQPVITNGGGNTFRTAQFHGPAFQPMGKPGGMMMMRH
jgi:hypothetical protein